MSSLVPVGAVGVQATCDLADTARMPLRIHAAALHSAAGDSPGLRSGSHTEDGYDQPAPRPHRDPVGGHLILWSCPGPWCQQDFWLAG